MTPSSKYINLDKDFWANIRTISQEIGYTVRGKNLIRIPTVDEIKKVYEEMHLTCSHLINKKNKLTDYGEKVLSYFVYRAKVLNETVEPLLMDVDKARTVYDNLYKRLSPQCHIPMNKQKGEKKTPSYFTGMINMLIESNANGIECDYNPRALTTITRNGKPLRTFARWVDGAFPSSVNPIAVWEIKEYYYTTTFGSRVADGVYESLLDGMEIEDLREHEGVNVLHYLMVDSHNTWWNDGKSYLCRLIDMLNMGYVDEILFGSEIVDRLPILVKTWVTLLKKSD